MNRFNNTQLRPYAQKLRREMTKEELQLWNCFLRSLPVTVNRQKVIGPYIADFYIAKARLIVELDGSQHYEEEGIQNDIIRDEFFSQNGFKVLRFTNNDIRRNFKAVCEEIYRNVF